MPKKRILIKFSGELLKSNDQTIDLDKVVELGKEIEKIKNDYNIGIVFGGGNIFRGRSVKGININMSSAHYIGMTATIVNALALKTIFDSLSIKSRVISSFAYPQVVGTTSKFEYDKYFSDGEILIFAAGTGNPFVSTDTASTIRALEIGASVILKGTSVGGVYDSNPKDNPDAKQFKKLSYAEYLQIPNAFIIDRIAVILAAENHIPIYVFKWQKNSLKRAVSLRSNGTLIN